MAQQEITVGLNREAKALIRELTAAVGQRSAEHVPIVKDTAFAPLVAYLDASQGIRWINEQASHDMAAVRSEGWQRLYVKKETA